MRSLKEICVWTVTIVMVETLLCSVISKCCFCVQLWHSHWKSFLSGLRRVEVPLCLIQLWLTGLCPVCGKHGDCRNWGSTVPCVWKHNDCTNWGSTVPCVWKAWWLCRLTEVPLCPVCRKLHRLTEVPLCAESMVTVHWHWQTDRFHSAASCVAVPVRLWLCLALWLYLTCDRHCQTGPAAISLLVSLILNIVTNRTEGAFCVCIRICDFQGSFWVLNCEQLHVTL